MRKLLLFICMLVSIWTVSCSSGVVRSTILDVESYIDEYPDSALAVLQALPVSDLGTRRLRALHSLLYSAALDKNYIDVASDSIISPAVKYYSRRGSRQHRMMTLYYSGRVRFNAGEYAQAAVLFMRAAEIAEDEGDSFYSGLIYRGIAQTYWQTYNPHEASVYMQKAYESFLSADKDEYADYALLALAKSYHSVYNSEEGISLYESLIARAKIKRDTSFLAQCIEGLVLLLGDEADPDYQRMIMLSSYAADSLGVGFTPAWCEELAVAYAYTGDTDSYEDLCEVLTNSSDNYTDNMFRLYRLNKVAGNHYHALVDLESAIERHNHLTYKALEQSVTSAHRDLLKSELYYDRILSRLKSICIITLILLFSIISAVLIVSFRSKIRDKEARVALLMSQIHNISMERDRLDHTANEFSLKIQSLYETKFRFIDSICQQYYSYQGDTRIKYVIKEVDSLVAALSDDKEILTLEAIVNAYKNNVITILRSNFPSLKLKDIRFMCYWYAGFSPMTMSVFLDERVENIYNRKSRMRKRIENSTLATSSVLLDNLP